MMTFFQVSFNCSNFNRMLAETGEHDLNELKYTNAPLALDYRRKMNSYSKLSTEIH